MNRTQRLQRAYGQALLNLVIETGYPEYPEKTEDLEAVKIVAKRFRVTPEQVAKDLPLAAREYYRKPKWKEREHITLVDDFD